MNTFFTHYTEFGVVPIRHSERSYFRSNEYSALKHSVIWHVFDQECRHLKEEIARCGKILRSKPHDTETREKIFTLKNLVETSSKETKPNMRLQ